MTAKCVPSLRSFGYEASIWGTPGRFCHTNATRSGSGNGKGARINPCTTLNIAVFAPIPSASVSTATVVKPRSRARVRKLNRRSSARVSRFARSPLLRVECGVASSAASRSGLRSSSVVRLVRPNLVSLQESRIPCLGTVGCGRASKLRSRSCPRHSVRR
jgi:hypothetical protein